MRSYLRNTADLTALGGVFSEKWDLMLVGLEGIMVIGAALIGCLHGDLTPWLTLLVGWPLWLALCLLCGSDR